MGEQSREIQIVTKSIKHLPTFGMKYVWLLRHKKAQSTQSSYSYSFSYQFSICFGKHECNCSAPLSIGSIGAELTSSNVSMFITSDAGNTWRQVTLTVGGVFSQMGVGSNFSTDAYLWADKSMCRISEPIIKWHLQRKLNSMTYMMPVGACLMMRFKFMGPAV